MTIKAELLRSRVVAACKQAGVEYDGKKSSVKSMVDSLVEDAPEVWLEFADKYSVQTFKGKFYNMNKPEDTAQLFRDVKNEYGIDSD